MVQSNATSKTTPSTRAAFSCSVDSLDMMFCKESIFAPIGTRRKLSRDNAIAVTLAYTLSAQ